MPPLRSGFPFRTAGGADSPPGPAGGVAACPATDHRQRLFELLETTPQQLQFGSLLARPAPGSGRRRQQSIHLVPQGAHAADDQALPTADDGVQCIGRDEGDAAALPVGDHLGQNLSRDVGPGGAVHDPEGVSGADDRRDLIERDVATVRPVVELPAAAPVARYHSDHAFTSPSPCRGAAPVPHCDKSYTSGHEPTLNPA